MAPNQTKIALAIQSFAELDLINNSSKEQQQQQQQQQQHTEKKQAQNASAHSDEYWMWDSSVVAQQQQNNEDNDDNISEQAMEIDSDDYWCVASAKDKEQAVERRAYSNKYWDWNAVDSDTYWDWSANSVNSRRALEEEQ
mmetsp:Transcript_25557/g.36393  ORF Transcript_25557/g.36393 Transcript_25557/m.36393 type:complete len:140 (-) Transcript_25557:124-543(-)|eukprot:CAMPEP_0202451866 /NCGR_PEP_ID=MMETSP1360-20130828/10196_1 /ASSEMBLY_ACC=CAM_ASM_000848 /TAXON_ID=515479 /ORGANISM="Licmophora paradoxa, Strain CCMP2313" /LENGTH=139 /DNA_ID=CAMNT_0049070533 /DNA_START=203 /DNA_END=622 /DNA_ORIENTATION=+